MSKIKLIVLIGLLLALDSCKQDKYVQGQRIYEAYCLQCHMSDGTGLGSLYPQLSNSVYLSVRKNDLVCLIREGKQSEQLATIQMPKNKHLKEAELSNLINYLSHEWGDQQSIQITDIRSQMKKCP